VFASLSAVLIILLTKVLVKPVSGNRTTEIVAMGRQTPRNEITDQAGDHSYHDDDVIYNNDEIVNND
jgi:hypothetical protein